MPICWEYKTHLHDFELMAKRSSHIVIARHEQVGEYLWKVINSTIKQWNDTHQHKFINIENVLLKVIFTSIEHAEHNDLIEILKNLQNDKGVKYHEAIQKEYDEADYNTADFIHILGITLDGQKDPFVLNEEEAFLPERPCITCGYTDIFSKTQIHPLIVNEALLKSPIDGFVKPGNEDWDLINVYGGRLLVSGRIIALLMNNHGRGFVTRKVLKPDGVTFSDRVFQLEAEKQILIPSYQVKQPNKIFFCEVCGAATKETDQEFNVDENWIKDLDFFSRHPNNSSLIHVSGRIYRLLREDGVNGMVTGDIVSVSK